MKWSPAAPFGGRTGGIKNESYFFPSSSLKSLGSTLSFPLLITQEDSGGPILPFSAIDHFFIFFPPIVPPMVGLWGAYHPELVDGPLPLRSPLSSYGVLREAQRGAHPPDHLVYFEDTILPMKCKL